jgi:hypothetical protein
MARGQEHEVRHFRAHLRAAKQHKQVDVQSLKGKLDNCDRINRFDFVQQINSFSDFANPYPEN